MPCATNDISSAFSPCQLRRSGNNSREQPHLATNIIEPSLSTLYRPVSRDHRHHHHGARPYAFNPSNLLGLPSSSSARGGGGGRLPPSLRIPTLMAMDDDNDGTTPSMGIMTRPTIRPRPASGVTAQRLCSIIDQALQTLDDDDFFFGEAAVARIDQREDDPSTTSGEAEEESP